MSRNSWGLLRSQPNILSKLDAIKLYKPVLDDSEEKDGIQRHNLGPPKFGCDLVTVLKIWL